MLSERSASSTSFYILLFQTARCKTSVTADLITSIAPDFTFSQSFLISSGRITGIRS